MHHLSLVISFCTIYDNDSPDPFFAVMTKSAFLRWSFSFIRRFKMTKEKTRMLTPKKMTNLTKGRGERSMQAVYSLVKQNPSTTISDLTSDIGVLTRSIEKQITRLKEQKND